jgi:lysine-specific demethylase 8
MDIERIRMPSKEEFWAKYVLPRRPVIVSGVFDGEPIRELATLAAFRARFGGLTLDIDEEYSSAFLKRLEAGAGLVDLKPQKMTVDEYLAFAAANPSTSKMALDTRTEGELRALYQTPALLDGGDVSHHFFLGNGGNIVHIHFDYYPSHVLFYQVFGRKRVVLIPTEAAQKLSPVTNFANVFLENFSEPDKRAFIEFCGGWDCVLEPGDALLMPMLIWHYIEYVDSGLSFNIRFGENQWTKRLHKMLFPNLHVQNVIARFTDGPRAAERWAAELELIEQTYARAPADLVEKYRQLKPVMRDVYKRVCADVARPMYSFTGLLPLEDQLISEIQRRRPA